MRGIPSNGAVRPACDMDSGTRVLSIDPLVLFREE